MSLRESLQEVIEAGALVTPYLPPAFGALLGLRYAKDQTPGQKAVGFLFGFGLAVYFGPAAAEILSLGPNAAAAAHVLIAVAGMDVVAGFVVVTRQFSASPMTVVRDVIKAVGEWFDARLGRGK